MTQTLKTVFTGTGALSASNVIARFVSFVGIIIVTHTLSLYEYGVVTLVLAISGPVLSIVNLGLDEMIIADVARFRSEGLFGNAKHLLNSYYSMQFLLLLFVLICGWFGRTYLEQRYGPAFREEGLALTIYIIVQVLRTSSVTFLNMHKRFIAIAILGSLEPILRVILFVMFAVTHFLTPSTTIYAYAFGSLLTVIATIPYCFKIIREYRSVQVVKEYLFWNILKKHGKWQGSLAILSSIISNIKYYFIKLLLSTEAVSIYSVAQNMYGAIASLIPLKTVVAPLLAERVHTLDRLRVFVAKASKYTFLVYCALMISVMIVAPFFILFFFPKYGASILIFEIMALRFPLNTFSLIQAPILIALRDQRFLSRVAIVNGISVLIFAPTLIHFFGLPGAVIESLITVFFVILQRESRLRKKYEISTWNFRAFSSFNESDRELLGTVSSYIRRKLQHGRNL